MDADRKTRKPLLLRFIHFMMFVNQPIKRRFSLFFLGVLWWFLVMTVLSLSALVLVEDAVSDVKQRVHPVEQSIYSLSATLDKLHLCLSGSGKPVTAPHRNRLLIRAHQLLNELADEQQTLSAELNNLRDQEEAVNPSEVEEMVRLLNAVSMQTREMRSLLLGMEESVQRVSGEADTFDREFASLTSIAGQASISVRSAQEQLVHLKQVRYDEILRVVMLAASGSLVVLAVATILLVFFTYSIRKAIADPIHSLIEQVDALVEGNADLNRRIEISSDDEIGGLSSRLNLLTEKIHALSVFKRVIEEDPGLESVYVRLGEVFSAIGLPTYILYETTDDGCPVPIYPVDVEDPHADRLVNAPGKGPVCRAARTNRTVTSMEFPGVCGKICRKQEEDHACIPILLSSGKHLIAQFIFPHPVAEQAAQVERKLKLALEYLETSRNVIESKKLLEELRETAIRDPLTGLYNRRFLNEIVDTIIPGVVRRGEHVAVIMADIDHFKSINDQLGHDAGDAMLQGTANVFRACKRTSDLVVRYGGEEFLLLLRDVDGHDVLQLAERIRKHHESHVVRYRDERISRTISLGFCQFPSDSADFWEAVQLADIALLHAKRSGRNNSVAYDRTMKNGSSQ